MTEPIDPRPPVLAGDWDDDDAAILDSIVEQQALPPAPDELPTEYARPLPHAEPQRRNHRIMARSGAYNGATPPITVLPADPVRTCLTITALGFPTLLADDGALAGSSGMSYIIPAGATIQLDGYTGPVILAPYNGTGGDVWGFSLVAVTS